jgi:hypothetical protein
MLKTIRLFSKSSFSQLLLLTISAVLALGVFSSALQAQPGSPNYKYPVLQQKDFKLFLDMSKYLDEDEIPASLFIDNKVSEEYASSVFMKITLNVVAAATGNKDEIAKQFGPYVIFNADELAIYKQNEEPVNQAVAKFAQKSQDSN